MKGTIAAFFILLFNFGYGQDSLRIAQELDRSKDTYLTNLDSSFFYAKNVVKWSQSIDEPWQTAWGLKMVGVYFQLRQEYDSAISYFLESRALFLQESDSLEIGKSDLSLAQMYLEKGIFDEALAKSLSAKDYFERLDNEVFLNRVFDAIAQIYSLTGDHVSALPYFHKANKLTIARKDTFNMATALANLASVHNYLNNWDSVRYYFDRALPLLERTNNQFAMANLQQTMGNSYVDRGIYEDARPFLLKAQEFFELAGITIGIAETNMNLGRLEQRQRNFSRAKEYYEKALTTSMSLGVTEIPMMASENLKRVYGELGDFKKAFEVSLLNDSLQLKFMDEEKQKTISNLEVSFRTKEKEQQIELQNAELSQQDIKLQRNQAVIIGLLVVAILLAVIVFLIRNKSQREKDLLQQEAQLKLREAEINAVISSQEKERNRFARDLHDGFGQLISVLKLNLAQLGETSAKDAEKRFEVYKNGESVINEMYAELRNICFDLMPQTLVKRGLMPALKEFGSRVNQTDKVSCEVMVFANNERLPELVEISLFRITQEWVNNILKYAKADQITIQLIHEDDEITLTVEDNGDGFDPQFFYNGTGNGWKNIQTRLNQIKGEFDLDSRPGIKGTMMTVIVDTKGISKRIPTSTEEELTA